MSIKSGRNGTIQYDATAASPSVFTTLTSVNTWKLSLKTDYEDVTCFGDTNKVYVPGLRDISGSLGGFWNSSQTTIIDASSATTPGTLRLTPNSTESSFYFEGLAYIDADIDCSLAAPKVSATFKAAGPWIVP